MAGSDLAGFIGEVTGESHLRVEEDLGGGFVRLRVSEAERRQAKQDIRCVEDVVLELLRNARDAGAGVAFLATRREGGIRTICCIDDGAGIPPAMWARVFEPRVTSKLDAFREDQWGVHGRGMALFSIASNTVEHRVAASGEGMGCAMLVRADASALPEKADQSSQPRLLEDAGRAVLRGPRNINRIVAEFTMSPSCGCLVYLGSPNEVLATMVALGTRALSIAQRAAADAQQVPVCLRPALAVTPEELAEVAASLGLETSARSARRILDGEIAPIACPCNIAAAPAGQNPAASPGATAPVPASNRRRVHVAAADRDALSRRMKEAYRDFAEAYYLDPDVEPAIRVGRDGLTVSIPFAEPRGEGGGL